MNVRPCSSGAVFSPACVRISRRMDAEAEESFNDSYL